MRKELKKCVQLFIISRNRLIDNKNISHTHDISNSNHLNKTNKCFWDSVDV